MPVLDEGDGEAFEEEEEHAVEEALVEGYEDEDRFCGEEHCGCNQHFSGCPRGIWLRVVLVRGVEIALHHGRIR